jgi:LysM repeat protein
MFGVNRGFTQPPDAPELSVSPDIPANMDTITRDTDSKIRGITKGVMTQLPPTAEYRVDEGESLLTVVETLNAGKPTSQHVTLEEIGELNDIPNAVGDPFGKIKKGDVLRVPVKKISPTEFMDNETKAMLRDATPIKANFITESLSSLTGKLSNATKELVNSYSTSTTKGLGTKDTSTYKVERGDTMYDIAKRQGVTLDKLMEANPDVDADRIGVGQVINIPKGSELNDLPPSLQTEVATAITDGDVKNKEDLNVAIFNGVIKDGTFATPKVGDDPLTWIAQNTFGLNENDPEFRKAFKAITKVDPYMTPWCAAFAGHVLRNVGVELPSRAIQNPNLAFNYINLGDEVYDHNPTTNKTYAGKPSDVKAGDVVVFNNSNRDSKGNIMYGQGHISFVVDVLDDGTIIATGGNQSDGTQVATTAYTPDIIKEFYKGGYTVRRITTNSLKATDPSIIAAITKDISIGGAEQ